MVKIYRTPQSKILATPMVKLENKLSLIKARTSRSDQPRYQPNLTLTIGRVLSEIIGLNY